MSRCLSQTKHSVIGRRRLAPRRADVNHGRAQRVLSAVVTQFIASVTAARELSAWSSMSKPC